MNKPQHDTGIKSVFGHSANFSGRDIMALTLANPKVAIHIVRKPWREFISNRANTTTVSTLAADFHLNGYRIKPSQEALLTDLACWVSARHGVLIKSPVEQLVGTVRLVRLPVQNQIRLVRAGRRLGRDHFNLPNVKDSPGAHPATQWEPLFCALHRAPLPAGRTRSRVVQ